MRPRRSSSSSSISSLRSAAALVNFTLDSPCCNVEVGKNNESLFRFTTYFVNTLFEFVGVLPPLYDIGRTDRHC